MAEGTADGLLEMSCSNIKANAQRQNRQRNLDYVFESGMLTALWEVGTRWTYWYALSEYDTSIDTMMRRSDWQSILAKVATVSI